MATATTRMVLVVKEMLQLSSSLRLRVISPPSHFSIQLPRSLRPAIRCASSDSDGANRVSARLSQVNQLLQQAELRALSADQTPPPKITLGPLSLCQFKTEMTERRKKGNSFCFFGFRSCYSELC